MSMFDYSQTGLPSNPQWMLATDLCHQWLGAHMPMFSPERHLAFLSNQPIAAAKRVFDNCDQFTPESITVLLLGPAKDDLIETAGAARLARRMFGDGVVDLIQALRDPALQQSADPMLLRDIGRIILAEGISTMKDQLIGRQRIDRHHAVRWDILRHLEDQGRRIVGADPALDVLFADALIQARQSLEALDAAATVKKPPSPPVV